MALVHGYCVLNDRLYLVQKRYPRSLGDVLRGGQRLPPSQALLFGKQLFIALEELSTAGVVMQVAA